MKYKHSAFIENTPEMREWLEKIGYESFGQFIDEEAQCITTGLDGYYYTLDIEEIESIVGLNDIDCRSNPELFQAVTAIRGDSDKNKHFICFEIDEKKLNKDKAEFEIDEKYIAKIGDIYKSNNTSFNSTAYKYGKWRECSLSELKEHFKAEKSQKV